MTWARKATLLMSVMLAVTASGCILNVDDDDDVFTLSVDFFWDVDLSDQFFEGDTCREAGVDTMDYELVDRFGRTWVQETFEPCANGLDFTNLPAGTYRLFIWGFDRSGDELWSRECRGLRIPFRDIYDCEVDAPGLL